MYINPFIPENSRPIAFYTSKISSILKNHNNEGKTQQFELNQIK